MRYFCPKCGNELQEERELDYPLVCMDCDENFYRFEAVKRPDNMRIVRERTFTMGGENPCHGYEVEYGSRIVPAFTHEQMKECQRVQAELVETHSNEEFALLECHGREWREVYYDGVWACYTPVKVDGIELYFLGMDEWPWDL